MKKKILFFHPALAPYRIDQFNSLTDKFDVHIVFLFKDVWYDKFDQQSLLKEAKFQYSFLLKGPSYKGRVFRFGIFSKINQIKPDFIFGYEYSFTTLYLVFLSFLKLIKIPLGTTTDDSLDMLKNMGRFRKIAQDLSLKKINYLVVLTDVIKRYYMKEKKISEHRIIVASLLQDANKIRRKEKKITEIAQFYATRYNLINKKNILFCGRLVEVKGLKEFLINFSKIDSLDEINLIFVGDGVLKIELIKLAGQLNLKNVYFPGKFDKEDLYAWYVVASCLVLPSKFEPFGAVVNEAHIFGLPVFCSNIAGAKELIKTSAHGVVFDASIDYSKNLNSFIKKLDTLSNIEFSDSIAENFDKSKEWYNILK